MMMLMEAAAFIMMPGILTMIMFLRMLMVMMLVFMAMFLWRASSSR